MEFFTLFLWKPFVPDQESKNAGKSLKKAQRPVKRAVGLHIQLLVLLLFTVTMHASAAAGVVNGKIVDADTKEPLVGATVTIKGTSKTTSAGLDGTFKIDVNGVDNPILVISYVGYVTKEVPVSGTNNVGEISLKYSANSMSEVVVNGDVAIDRKTPVAVTTIGAQYIEEHIGTQDIPELLNIVPGVYSTQQGGGYGDSRISIRGFSSQSKNGNVAYTINGIPVNDPESGAIYWSDFSGNNGCNQLYTGAARIRRLKSDRSIIRRNRKCNLAQYGCTGRRLCLANFRQRRL